MSGQGKDDTIAARVPHDLRAELEARRDELARAGVHYPDGRPVDLSYVIRVGLRAFLDGVVTLDGLRHNAMYGPGYGDPGRMAEALTAKPRAHTDGPDTAKIAAALAWPTAEGNRRRVLLAVANAGSEGRTADELVTGLRMYSAQRRLHDLKRGGWVRPKRRPGDTRKGEPLTVTVKRETRHGRPAEVYVLTAAAETRLAAEGRLAA